MNEMKKYTPLITIIIVVLLLFSAFFMLKQEYRPFDWGGEKCITYKQDCTCIGLLITLESYPPKYSCKGINYCKDINITECE